MIHLVKVLRGFMYFRPGERLYVSDEFLRRYGRYLTVLEKMEMIPQDDFFVEDEPVDKVLAAFDASEKGLTKEPSDGKDDHLQGEG